VRNLNQNLPSIVTAQTPTQNSKGKYLADEGYQYNYFKIINPNKDYLALLNPTPTPTTIKP
jgi:hypothetical protein